MDLTKVEGVELVRDKSRNTPEFQRKWKKRREKSKFDAKARKLNRRKK